MSEPSTPSDAQALEAQLRAVADRLRRADHLDTATQAALANLIDELGAALRSSSGAEAELAHLGRSAAEMASSLHDQHEQSLLGAARARLEEAALNAETKAPFATGVVRRLLDVLASLGI